MLRKLLSHVLLIHFLVVLGLFALWGYIMTDNLYLVLCAVLSFSGAVCGAFIRVIDEIRKRTE